MGWKTCKVALALAMRGVNVDPVFFFWGPGGVGMSITTAHLENMLGHANHKLFDPSVFYLEDELRKQVELLRGSIVLIGQERPEGMSNKFREDLFNKFATGDGIFGRLPYQVLTKVINLVGWKRMETNKLPTIDGATEGNYNSLYRKWCHIQHAGELFDAKYIKKQLEGGKRWG